MAEAPPDAYAKMQSAKTIQDLRIALIALYNQIARNQVKQEAEESAMKARMKNLEEDVRNC